MKLFKLKSADCVARFSIRAVYLICFFDVVGWIFNIPMLKSVDPRWVPMQVITAVCLSLSAFSISMIKKDWNHKQKIGMVRIIGVVIIFIAVLTISEYAHVYHRGTSSLLSHIPVFHVFLTSLTRMAFLTACSFVIIGCSLVLMTIGNKIATGIAHALTLCVALESYLILTSYILGVYSIHEFLNMPVALTTGISFFFICLTILTSRTDSWLMNVFTSERTGSIMARNLLPGFMAMPVLIGWLRILGERTGIFTSEVGTVLVAVTYILCFTLLIWQNAKAVNKIDDKRRISEETLRQSEENLRAILDATQESIYMFDKQNKFVVANRIGVKRLNFKREELLGHDFSEFVSPELAASRVEHLMKVFDTGNPERFEDKRNGMHFEHYFYPCFTDGNVSHVASYSRDITDIRQKEHELIKLNRILKALGKSSQAMLKAIDEKSFLEEVCRIIVEDSGFAMVWIGYVRNDEAKSVEPVAYSGFEKGYLETLKITWADTERGRGPTGTAIRTGKPAACRNMVTDPAFLPWREEAVKRGYASSLVLPLFNNDEVFGAISFYSSEPDPFVDDEMFFLNELASDLSYGIVSFRLKEARELAEKGRIESEEKLNLALENGNIGVWVWDIVTNEIEWDNRMEKIFGVPKGTFGKTYESFESYLVDEDIPHVRQAIQKALHDNVHFETIYRIKLNNGKTNYVNAKALVTKDCEGKPVKMTGVCFDVTEMKRGAEKVLFKLNEELLRSNKELEQFAYVASHDLQEPLRMVSSFTQLLAQRYGDKLDQDAKEFIQFAVDGSSRMQILINDLLAFSRIQTKGKVFSIVDMHEIFGKVRHNLSISIQERNALITNDDLPMVYVDEGQMIQLLQNLIGNAIKFSKNIPHVHLSAKECGEHFLFSVKDNGIGIEKQYFERIFQIFQRLLPKNEYDGTGIGLAICKRIIERHGGKIWLESEPGMGSIFYFTIQKVKRS